LTIDTCGRNRRKREDTVSSLAIYTIYSFLY